jgi:hyperosmotically inducible periplasmic protein
MRNVTRSLPIFLSLALGLLLGVGAVPTRAASAQRDAAHDQTRIAEEVRHQLILVPYVTVFDNLEYKVDGTEVTLTGQVTQSTVQRDAVNNVKRVEGVTKVNDQIELLPLSPMDSQIRRAAFNAIYRFPALEQYAQGTILPIRIIVKNGRLTLEGFVRSEGDKNIAGLRANGVPNVFSVTNNLHTPSSS